MTGTSEGTLLAGKLRYRQFTTGHRSGFEPVLLAAAINAKPSELVLEAGTGAGAALLCLGHRVQNLTGIGLEIDPALAKLANENFKINKLENFSCVISDAAQPPVASRFDHVMANPPWFDPAGTHSPDAARARAHHTEAGLLEAWIAGLSFCLKPRGSISLILPAASLTQAAGSLRQSSCGGITVFPLWPRAGKAARQIIISAIRHSRAPDRLLPGLTLHDEAGITPQANAVLSDAASLSLS